MFIGEIAGIATAVCWSFTSIAFEYAGKRIGSGPVNIIRLLIAFVILSCVNLLTVKTLMVTDISSMQVVWLMLSGFIGFVLGDLFLFEAFVIIGARISMLIMALSPPMSALIGFLVLGEQMSLLSLIGMVITLSGIAMVILNKPKNGSPKISRPFKGILFALLGALGQSVGLLFSKVGMGDMNAFAATQYRVLAGIIGFTLLLGIRGQLPKVMAAFKDFKGIMGTTIGAFFGPFLGVSLSLLAAQLTSLGIASTLMSLVPIMVIPVSVIVFKERVQWREIMGAVVAVAGVTLLFL